MSRLFSTPMLLTFHAFCRNITALSRPCTTTTDRVPLCSRPWSTAVSIPFTLDFWTRQKYAGLFTFDVFAVDITRQSRLFSTTTTTPWQSDVFFVDITTTSRLFGTTMPLTFHAFCKDITAMCRVCTTTKDRVPLCSRPWSTAISIPLTLEFWTRQM